MQVFGLFESKARTEANKLRGGGAFFCTYDLKDWHQLMDKKYGEELFMRVKACHNPYAVANWKRWLRPAGDWGDENETPTYSEPMGIEGHEASEFEDLSLGSTDCVE